MVAPLTLYTSAGIVSGPGALQVSLPFGILVLWAACHGPDCLVIDLSRMVEELIQTFSLSLQDVPLVSQRLSSICTEEGRRAGILWSMNSLQGIIEALGAMAVCLTLDFIGLLAILTITVTRNFICTFSFAFTKASVLACNGSSFWSVRNSWCFSYSSAYTSSSFSSHRSSRDCCGLLVPGLHM